MENTFQLGAFVIGITELFKGVGLPSKYCPMFAVLLSGVLNPVLLGDFAIQRILEGMMIGLAVTGLYKAADDKILDKIE